MRRSRTRSARRASAEAEATKAQADALAAALRGGPARQGASRPCRASPASWRPRWAAIDSLTVVSSDGAGALSKSVVSQFSEVDALLGATAGFTLSDIVKSTTTGQAAARAVVRELSDRRLRRGSGGGSGPGRRRRRRCPRRDGCPRRSAGAGRRTPRARAALVLAALRGPVVPVGVCCRAVGDRGRGRSASRSCQTMLRAAPSRTSSTARPVWAASAPLSPAVRVPPAEASRSTTSSCRAVRGSSTMLVDRLADVLLARVQGRLVTGVQRCCLPDDDESEPCGVLFGTRCCACSSVMRWTVRSGLPRSLDNWGTLQCRIGPVDGHGGHVTDPQVQRVRRAGRPGLRAPDEHDAGRVRRRPRRASWTRCRDAGSSSLVGSSRTMSAASVTRARARATRCCWPPESCSARLCRPRRDPEGVERHR